MCILEHTIASLTHSPVFCEMSLGISHAHSCEGGRSGEEGPLFTWEQQMVTGEPPAGA